MVEINQVLPWVDIETFGLDPERDPIIEIGIVVTNLNLEVIDSHEWLIWGPVDQRRLERMQNDTSDEFVLNMHTENGLFEDARKKGLLSHVVEQKIASWMRELTGKPMCGSSIHFDQKFITAQMPSLLELFHYRIIDNSTLKELCSRYNPELYAKAPEAKHVAPMHHRVSFCLEDTIAEFKFYRDEFLLW